MGRIKTRSIKRVGKQLVENYPELFTKDFRQNKKILVRFLETDSKKTLNKVAGYITRLIKIRESKVEVIEEL
ncbi:30S ribosomal protein S17e [Candidatus Marsarchaeota G2 archaeon ECH_B_SAG-F08]|jgi:small subunit ribosomal protein S17e|uniref:Small ribosomal subunit protein eS17 n=5 Tax=Candidatus Marsarchaeota TaxID=1978152 RepID=A0A2R6AKG7_9ARCH|nr:MAG: 30S ribosomal protein S17e [Candidatus Marsarchaeota G1 archaeon OSP_D]PSN86851.1 MAG: 30S ribosomal protein S17e [Candidatus Marsarchaeota G1 archaeon BE_D]PSN89120.1 MAG: 30S ribosomal protein S17e [Candidatus Marsarchaeota G1 archaeon OSP_C]PSN93147.1 MAG: 30S ribosomal protein S17e [Candidatus Marsarchaeota G1 archaeon OSP_B]PSN98149.1 MAG: 30S ribosomal protein S17e [Candidatus Marsarchaeota G2 archaeon ECH_B_SAG-F08]